MHTLSQPCYIIGYASTSHTDKDGDIIRQSWGDICNIPIRYMHRTSPQIGYIVNSWTTTVGLLIKARILPAFVTKLHALYYQGYCSFSIGMLIKHSHTHGNTRHIYGQLFEVSVVRQPTNPYCRFQFTHNTPSAFLHTYKH